MNTMIGICSMEEIDWKLFVREAKENGFRHVELRVDNVDENSYIFDEAYLKDLKDYIDQNKLSVSLHSIVGINLGEKVNRIRKTSVEIVCDIMRAGEKIGAQWVTTHLGSCGFSNKDTEKKYKRLDCVINSIKDIHEKTKGMKIKLALENLPKYPLERSQCRLGDCPEEFEYIFSNARYENVGMVLDIPHVILNNCHKEEEIKRFMEQFRENIVACHMHWNDGTNDTHSSLREASSEELEKCMQIFKKEENYNIPIIIECYEMYENKESFKIINAYLNN